MLPDATLKTMTSSPHDFHTSLGVVQDKTLIYATEAPQTDNHELMAVFLWWSPTEWSARRPVRTPPLACRFKLLILRMQARGSVQ